MTLSRLRKLPGIYGLDELTDPVTFIDIMKVYGVDEALFYMEAGRPEYDAQIYNLAADIVETVSHLHPACEIAIRTARDYAAGRITMDDVGRGVFTSNKQIDCFRQDIRNFISQLPYR